MYQQFNGGWLEVICGPMFAGKSEELIRRLSVLGFKYHDGVIAFKPIIDNRYDKSAIASHAGKKYNAIPLQKSEDLLSYINEKTKVVGIDEIQFFDSKMITFIDSLIAKDIRVIVAGLDMDFRGEPFGIMPTLLAKAQIVDKLQAICVKCGASGTHTQRLINGEPASYNDPIILVGAKESYEARCSHCHEFKKK